MNINSLTRVVGRAGLIVSKHSPEILMGLGITGVIGSTVLSCRATLKAQTVIAKAKSDLDTVNDAWKAMDHKEYTEEDRKRDITGVYGEAAGKLIRLYGPAVALGVVSISCLVGSHHILTKRNAGLAAAYTLLDEGFKKYRKNVVDKYGAEEDDNMRFGATSEAEVTATDSEGNETKKEMIADTQQESTYTRWFNDTNIHWQHDPSYNLWFLRTRQSLANKQLQANGFIFLRDVYEMLGFPQTPDSIVVGWLWNSKEDDPIGDNYVDFRLDNPINKSAGRIVNGNLQGYLIDPNVQGTMYNRI